MNEYILHVCLMIIYTQSPHTKHFQHIWHICQCNLQIHNQIQQVCAADLCVTGCFGLRSICSTMNRSELKHPNIQTMQLTIDESPPLSLII